VCSLAGWGAIGILFASLGAASGCTLLVTFDEKPAPDCDGGDCADATALDAPLGQGAAPPADAAAEGPALDDGGGGGGDACARLPDGAVCDFLDCNTCSYCVNGACTQRKACPEGYNWDKKNTLARCCGGLAVLTNTNANCGVCGVVCKTAGGLAQDCVNVAGHFLCGGCTTNTECWSKCCSTAPAPTHCAASDCNSGACPGGICPAPSRCVPGIGTAPNYCTYD
jgi:hypothetical protein